MFGIYQVGWFTTAGSGSEVAHVLNTARLRLSRWFPSLSSTFWLFFFVLWDLSGQSFRTCELGCLKSLNINLQSGWFLTSKASRETKQPVELLNNSYIPGRGNVVCQLCCHLICRWSYLSIPQKAGCHDTHGSPCLTFFKGEKKSPQSLLRSISVSGFWGVKRETHDIGKWCARGGFCLSEHMLCVCTNSFGLTKWPLLCVLVRHSRFIINMKHNNNKNKSVALI